MFLGQYLHTIDDKSRLTIPAKFRELLPDGAFLTHGFDRNLMVLPTPIFNHLAARVGQMNLSDPNARTLKRILFSNAWPVEVDKLGRILIPQYLRESAQIESAAVINGANQFFEIWSQPIWTETNARQMDPEVLAQSIASADLTLL